MTVPHIALSVFFSSSVSIVFITPDRRQSETLIISTNIDQKSLATEFSIAICRSTDDKWQSKTLFLWIFYPRSSIVKHVFDCRLLGVFIINVGVMTVMCSTHGERKLITIRCHGGASVVQFLSDEHR